MKSLKEFIQEGFKFGKNQMKKYSCQPQTKDELMEILKKRLVKNADADLNDIDVYKIEDMSCLFYHLGLFEGAIPHNIKIDKWDVSNVKNMDRMFCACYTFDADLSNWNIKNVKNMNMMFHGCENFKGKGLEKWNVSKATDMSEMFYLCKKIRKKPSWYVK